MVSPHRHLFSEKQLLARFHLVSDLVSSVEELINDGLALLAVGYFQSVHYPAYSKISCSAFD